jgi:phenylacetate-CoA ligase
MSELEMASRDEISALQLRRLQETVRWAYDRVAHYRQSFADAGLVPDDLKELSDLSRFPFLTKSDLRDNYPFGMFAVPREDIIRIHASSGTTGQPTVVGYTRKDLDTWTDLVARNIQAAGGRRGDILHNAYGYGLFTGGLGFHYGAERLGCTTVPLSGGQTEKQVRLIQDFQPTLIGVTPSYLLAIGEEFERQGIDPRETSLEVAICGAEPWSESMRKEIEHRFSLHVVDCYGLSEVMGPGVSAECVETKDGLHIWEDHFYPEIIDPDTGAVLPDGEKGELVWTSLTKEAFPVIRYRSRDLSQLLPGTARSFRRMEKVLGRNDDMLIIRGVNVFPSQIEEIIVGRNQLAPHYQLEVRREGSLDTLDIIVEIAPEYAGYDSAERAETARELRHHVKSRVGVSASVSVVDIGTIPRSEGKAVRIVDHRNIA